VTDSIEQFIESLHFGCMAIAMEAMINGSENISERVVNYLHTCLADLLLDDERRAIIDRMAAKIAVDGLDINYGAYK
jgi:hypothetical protein